MFGFKFYVPLTPQSYRDLTPKLFELVDSEGLGAKAPANIEVLTRINSGGAGLSQIGKNFVIYSPQPKLYFLRAVIKILDDSQYEFPIIPYAVRIGKHPLYYRYGNYVEASDDDDRFKYDEVLLDKDFVQELIGSLPISQAPGVETGIDQFLVKYPVLEAVNQSGKSGVFKALDLSQDSYTEVIVKVGYHLGAIDSRGIDGAILIKRERDYITRIRKAGPKKFKLPRIIDYFDSSKSSALVLELIDGESGAFLRKEKRLSIENFILIESALAELHDLGFTWGDAKISNALWLNRADASPEVFLLDVEHASEVGAANQINMRTFRYLDCQLRDSKALDHIDLLVSAVYEEVHGRQSAVVLESVIKTRSSEFQTFCSNRLKEILVQQDDKTGRYSATLRESLYL